MNYPEDAGYAKNSDTSREAAEMLTDRTQIQNYVVRKIGNAGQNGMTVDEMKVAAEEYFRRGFDRSTIAARFTELEADKRIVKSNLKRKTPRKRWAYAYVAPSIMVLPFEKTKKKEQPAQVLAQKLWDALTFNRDGTGTIHLSKLDLACVESLAVQAGLSKE